MIAWNAPKPYLPAAELLVKRAFDDHFGNKPWDFSHTDTRERFTLYTAGSSTLSALEAEPMRLPQEFYDVKP